MKFKQTMIYLFVMLAFLILQVMFIDSIVKH